MGIYEFNMLSQEKQLEVVLNGIGKFLDNWKGPTGSFNLYAVDRFFVEVEYIPIENKIVAVRSFIEGHLLDKYSGFRSF